MTARLISPPESPNPVAEFLLPDGVCHQEFLASAKESRLANL
jgi:hypothetical protein